ncbi:MAG: DUF2064 domain-containing protein [Cyclobacteriaceae bacterium]|nr:DUF2064 domain-containing protein [Cyclobacteriaceae bacterium HetDA_MAG_MS6]
MKAAFPSTALLVFARSSQAEAQHKNLLSGSLANRKLLKSLRQHTLNIASNSGLITFQYSEQDQKGQSFGERISNSIQEVFDKGYRHIIVIGSDCPDLVVEDIHLATDQLNESGLVIGPDHRGGTFLLGLTQDGFDRQAFSKLAWQSKDLVSSLTEYASSRGYDTSYLSPKYDVNDLADLVKLSQKSTLLNALLEEVFSLFKTWDLVRFSLVFQAYYHLQCRRGPPAISDI